MGKLKVSANVDLASATISGVLKQIRRSNVTLPENHVPATQKVWICDVLPHQTKAVVRFIEEYMKPVDSTDFTHVKRFRKREVPGSASVYISTILCPSHVFTAKNELHELLKAHFDADLEMSRLFQGTIPSELPPTKELSVKWSNEIWPLSWKGNPNHQDLITAYFDVAEESRLIDQLSKFAQRSDDLPVCTMVAEQDPVTKKITVLHLELDSRKEHILRHSVMNAVAAVARAELDRREVKKVASSGTAELGPDGYLCHNLLVYTTHEPCTMCAMALVHSRIGRLVYLKTHPLGAIESSHYIGDRRDLNWTFDIWRWVGPQALEVSKVPDTDAP